MRILQQHFQFLLFFTLLLISNPILSHAISTVTVMSRDQLDCTMCSACDNPCQPISSPPPPSPPLPSPPLPSPSSDSNCPPPPSLSPPSSGTYYYSPPPPLQPSVPTYNYYSPPPPAGGGGGSYYYPTPPPPNPIVPYFPFYYYNPPPGSPKYSNSVRWRHHPLFSTVLLLLFTVLFTF